jgi:hypothetical protein
MEPMNNQNTLPIPLRADKAIAWLTESRDQWKQKCLQAKLQLKRQTLALKRARDGRLHLKHLLQSLKTKNQKLELILQKQQAQLSELKKKHSPKKAI